MLLDADVLGFVAVAVVVVLVPGPDMALVRPPPSNTAGAPTMQGDGLLSGSMQEFSSTPPRPLWGFPLS